MQDLGYLLGDLYIYIYICLTLDLKATTLHPKPQTSLSKTPKPSGCVHTVVGTSSGMHLFNQYLAIDAELESLHPNMGVSENVGPQQRRHHQRKHP